MPITDRASADAFSNQLRKWTMENVVQRVRPDDVIALADFYRAELERLERDVATATDRPAAPEGSQLRFDF